MIPFFNSVIAIEQAIVNSSTNATAVADSKTKLVRLEEARKGWQDVIDRDDKLYADARAGKLERVTHLVAEALLQDSNGNDNVTFINGTKAKNADGLRQISAIRYGVTFIRSCFVYKFFF